MGRKLRVGAAMACLLVLGTVTVASATSSRENRSSGSDDRKVVVLDLVGEYAKSTFIDELPANPEDQPSVGDQWVSTINLLRDGKEFGKESSICTYTRVEADGARTVHCTGFQFLPGGQTTSEVAVDYGPGETVKADPYFSAVKGGTRKYRTAHGEARIQERTTEKFEIVVRIILSRTDHAGWRPSSGRRQIPSVAAGRQGSRA